jgi:hypothetical protein
MRILCFLLGYFVIQTSTYAFVSKNDSGLQFIINEDSITENSHITLLIKNNSLTDYYLPIIKTEKTLQWNALFNMEARNFFFINTVFMTDSTGEIPWGTENCYDMGDYDFFEKYWSQKLNGIKSQNMILIKSGDSAKVKMPVELTVKYSEFCIWKLQDYDKFNRINVCFTYEPKTFDMEEKFLSKSTISKLKRMGYELYTNKIVSDTVEVYRNHRSTQIVKDTLHFDSNFNVKDYVEIPKGSLQWKYYTYCVSNLKPIKRIKTYPGFRVEDLCSIRSCFQALLRPEISEVMYKRLVEIARDNYKNKIYLYLISGKGSVEIAEEHNRSIQKQNDFIYISVDSFINSKEIQKRIEIYNNETTRLLKKGKQTIYNQRPSC